MTDFNRQLASALIGWRPEFIGTLIFVQRGSQVLLIEKKTGHGAGRINGPGGKIEPDETPLRCALRELQEEVGLSARSAQLAATIRFVELDGPQWFGYIFRAQNFDGNAIETAEAKPRWHNKQALPLKDMWPDDALWLPRVLDGECLDAEFLFRDEHLLCGHMRVRRAQDMAPRAHELPAEVWR